jgi:hypothetical protein
LKQSEQQVLKDFQEFMNKSQKKKNFKDPRKIIDKNLKNKIQAGDKIFER